MRTFLEWAGALTEAPAHYVEPDETLKHLINVAYPDYRGKKPVRIQVTDQPIDARSSWEGGSRSWYVFVDLSTMRSKEAPESNAFTHGPDTSRVNLPPNVICVKQSMYRGKDVGITIFVRPDGAAKLLPEPTETQDLSSVEWGVLVVTSAYKSFARYDELRSCGVSRQEYDAAKDSLVAKGLLKPNASITVAGRNMASTKDRYDVFQTIKQERGVR